MDNPIRLHWLDPRDPRQPFPPASGAMRDPNGLLAIGGDLSVARLLRAYAQGIFPWYNPDEPILWWCPDPRAVLTPAEFHTSRSLARRLRQQDFAVTLNADFAAVLEACAAPRASAGDKKPFSTTRSRTEQQAVTGTPAAEPRARGRGTWLGQDMKHAYHELHERGHAQSLEVWRKGELMGGIYGVSIGRVFFGESMFSRMDDASKIALHFLCRQITAWGYELLDCQIASAHLASLGAVQMPRAEFLRRLRAALESGGRPGRWRFDLEVPAAPAHLPIHLSGR